MFLKPNLDYFVPLIPKMLFSFTITSSGLAKKERRVQRKWGKDNKNFTTNN